MILENLFLFYYFLNKSFHIFLKAFDRESIVGLVVLRSVYGLNAGYSKPHGTVYCDSFRNKINKAFYV